MNTQAPQTLAQAFEQLRSGLEMKATLKTHINQEQTRCREHLQKKWPGADIFFSGSYGRSTKIEPLNDVDLFVARRDSFPEIGKIPTPGEALLQELLRHLQELFPGQVRMQTRSIGITCSGFRMDVVPAFKRNGGGFFLADRSLPGPHWRFTDPRKQQQFTADQDRACGQMATPLVKMFKRWKAQQHLGLKSFHLEVMVLRSLSGKPISYPVGAQQVMEKLQYAIQKPCGDPGGSGGKLDDYLTDAQRHQIAERAQQHAQCLKEALVFDQAKQHAEALQRFRKVFG